MRGSWIGWGLGALGITSLTGCWNGPGPAVVPRPAVVAIIPAQAAVTVGRTLAFAARIDGNPVGNTTWRVLEPDGGRVDDTGRYRAPAAPGVFTVQALFKNTGQTAEAKVTVVAPPAGEISAPTRLLSGSEGQVARIAPVPGSSYHWHITGGEITRGTDTSAITFLAGTGPKVLLACKVINRAGDVLNTSLEVPVAPPVTLSINPASVTITAGRAMKFGFTIRGGISLAVAWSLEDPGAGSLDGSGNYVAPMVPGRYSVRVTSLDDPLKWAIARVQVVRQPPESLFAPEAFLPGARGLHATVPKVAGMTYAWEIVGGTITAGAATPALSFDAGDGPTLSLRCRITNKAGDSFLAAKSIKAL